MSENELLNNGEGVVEVVSEVGTSSNKLVKLAVVGAVVAATVGVVLYVKKRRSQKVEDNESIEVEKVSHSKKTDK